MALAKTKANSWRWPTAFVRPGWRVMWRAHLVRSIQPHLLDIEWINYTLLRKLEWRGSNALWNDSPPGASASSDPINLQIPKTQATVKFWEQRTASRLVLLPPDVLGSSEEMPGSLHLKSGKPQLSPINAAYGDDGSTSHHIFVIDINTNTSFLIDTHADVCVYPRSKIQGPTRKDRHQGCSPSTGPPLRLTARSCCP
jgi:hypothetical protein